MTDLFFRTGIKFEGTPLLDGKGKPFIMKEVACSRCGGAGGADKWNHTGWTCWSCGGSGRKEPRRENLFTAEKLAKLNAAAEKRAAKKAAKLAAKAAAEAAEAEVRKAAFLAAHGALIEKAKLFAARSSFVADVVAKAEAKSLMTERMAEALAAAIAKIEASDAAKAASAWFGKIGERITATVVTERVFTVETRFGAMHIVSMRDTNGNATVSKGSFVPAGARWISEKERWEVGTEPFTITATVKEHSEFRGEKRTVVNRVKELEPAR